MFANLGRNVLTLIDLRCHTHASHAHQHTHASHAHQHTHTPSSCRPMPCVCSDPYASIYTLVDPIHHDTTSPSCSTTTSRPHCIHSEKGHFAVNLIAKCPFQGSLSPTAYEPVLHESAGTTAPYRHSDLSHIVHIMLLYASILFAPLCTVYHRAHIHHTHNMPTMFLYASILLLHCARCNYRTHPPVGSPDRVRRTP